MRFSVLVALASTLYGTAYARIHQGSAMDGLADAANFQIEHMQNMRSFLGPPEELHARNEKREPMLTFRNPKAAKFHVDGTKIPDGTLCSLSSRLYYSDNPTVVNFDAGDSWSGLMPISSDPNETRKLFFWWVRPWTRIIVANQLAGFGLRRMPQIRTTFCSGRMVNCLLRISFILITHR